MAKQRRSTNTEPSPIPDPPDGGFAAELTDSPTQIPALRSEIRELANRHGFGARAGDVTLALDELVANAREHGRPPIVVRGWYDGRLVLTVTDAGAGFDFGSIVKAHPPVTLGTRSRGLWIVRQVTDHVEVERTPNGTTVRVELNHEPHIGA